MLNQSVPERKQESKREKKRESTTPLRSLLKSQRAIAELPSTDLRVACGSQDSQTDILPVTFTAVSMSVYVEYVTDVRKI